MSLVYVISDPHFGHESMVIKRYDETSYYDFELVADNRYVNVCCEVVNYTPVLLSSLL